MCGTSLDLLRALLSTDSDSAQGTFLSSSQPPSITECMHYAVCLQYDD
jgi:hypothetical protein